MVPPSRLSRLMGAAVRALLLPALIYRQAAKEDRRIPTSGEVDRDWMGIGIGVGMLLVSVHNPESSVTRTHAQFR